MRWTVVSTGQKAIRTHFLHPEHRKKRLGRSRLSDVLNRRMTHRTKNLLSECLKKLRAFDDGMFHDVEMPFKRFLYIQGFQKCDLDEFAEVM
jgi:hypothetical protein